MKTTEREYSKLMKGRQDRLDGRMEEKEIDHTQGEQN
jgi:hypothetical protein